MGNNPNAFSVIIHVHCIMVIFFAHSPSVKSRESGDTLDVRLLAGLIQDVWDKFFQLKESVQIRQRHETEALWLVQRELWKQRQSELGEHRDSLSLYHTLIPSHSPSPPPSPSHSLVLSYSLSMIYYSSFENIHLQGCYTSML